MRNSVDNTNRENSLREIDPELFDPRPADNEKNNNNLSYFEAFKKYISDAFAAVYHAISGVFSNSNLSNVATTNIKKGEASIINIKTTDPEDLKKAMNPEKLQKAKNPESLQKEKLKEGEKAFLQHLTLVKAGATGAAGFVNADYIDYAKHLIDQYRQKKQENNSHLITPEEEQRIAFIIDQCPSGLERLVHDLKSEIKKEKEKESENISLSQENAIESADDLFGLDDSGLLKNNSVPLQISADGYVAFMAYHTELENRNSVVGEIDKEAVEYAKHLITTYKDSRTLESANPHVKKFVDTAESLIKSDYDKKIKNLSGDVNEILENLQSDIADSDPQTIHAINIHRAYIDEQARRFVKILLQDNHPGLTKDESEQLLSDAEKFISWRDNWHGAMLMKEQVIGIPAFGEADDKEKERSFVERNYQAIGDEYKDKYPLNEEDLSGCERFVEKFNAIQNNGSKEQKILLEESDLQKYIDDFKKYYFVDKKTERLNSPIIDSVLVKENIAEKISADEIKQSVPVEADNVNPEVMHESKLVSTAKPVQENQISEIAMARRPSVEKLGASPNLPDFPKLESANKIDLGNLLFPNLDATLAHKTIDNSASYFDSIAKGNVPKAEYKASAIALANAWSNLGFFPKQNAIFWTPKLGVLDQLLDLDKINRNFIKSQGAQLGN